MSKETRSPERKKKKPCLSAHQKRLIFIK